MLFEYKNSKKRRKNHEKTHSYCTTKNTIKIVFPEQFEGLSGYDEEALVDYLKENSDGNYQKIECIDGQVNMGCYSRKKLSIGKDMLKNI